VDGHFELGGRSFPVEPRRGSGISQPRRR
jgi:hypothetical protein